ncbi:hypothetical protein MRX96_030385 [Rhipicephalus microplus]
MVACAVFSVAVLLIFLTATVGLLAMPEAAEPQRLKSRNASDVGLAGSVESNSSKADNASTSTSAGGLPNHPSLASIPYNTLICVLNADMSQKEVSQLPEDGLCDLSFYQAIEKEHAIVSGPGGPFNESLDLVIRAAAAHAKTEYGVSFDYT